jgi:hypothetical protein
MARQLRVEYAGDLHEAIFWDDEDRSSEAPTSQFYQEPV